MPGHDIFFFFPQFKMHTHSEDNLGAPRNISGVPLQPTDVHYLLTDIQAKTLSTVRLATSDTIYIES